MVMGMMLYLHLATTDYLGGEIYYKLLPYIPFEYDLPQQNVFFFAFKISLIFLHHLFLNSPLGLNVFLHDLFLNFKKETLLKSKCHIFICSMH